jgi:hypothetical protein
MVEQQGHFVLLFCVVWLLMPAPLVHGSHLYCKYSLINCYALLLGAQNAYSYM